jgi:flagellin-like hook-associated protein FlgL
MVLSIRTDIPALTATRHNRRTDTGLTSSLERLSTGLRINKAADDASGMVIAGSLTSQAKGLGQAIRNANDAISIVQVADAALEESIQIVNRIKTKSIQAAQDGQTLESRTAIQADIEKLIQELDQIANTTSFNNQKLLSGSFTNKFFQVGAYAEEGVHLSIDPAGSKKIGHLSTGSLVLDNNKEGVAHLGIKGGFSYGFEEIAPITLAYDNAAEHGIGGLADAVNQVSDRTGVRASAQVTSRTDTRIRTGMTDADFAINQIPLGRFAVQDGDADGALVKAINQKTVQHGIHASVTPDGSLFLSSTDGRGIKVEPPPGRGDGIDHIFAGKNLTTFGSLHLQGQGSGVVDIRDLGGGEPVSLLDNGLNTAADTRTVADSVLTRGSVLAENSVLGFPWTAEQTLSGERFAKSIDLERQTLIPEGGVLGQGSVLLTKDDLPDTVMVRAKGTTDTESLVKKGSLLKKDSILGAGTQLPAGNMVSAGTLFKGDAQIAATQATIASSFVKQDSVLAAGTVIASGSVLKGTAIVETVGPITGSADIKSGSELTVGSFLASGTIVRGTAVMDGVANTGSTYILSVGSILAAGSSISSGTTLGGDAVVDQIPNLSSSYSLAANSILTAGSELASGTVLKGTATVTATGPVTGDYELATGSILRSGSVIGSGTTLTDDVIIASQGVVTGSYTLESGSTLQSGTVLGNGTILTNAADIGPLGPITGNYTIAAGSIVEAGSVFGDGTPVNGSVTVTTTGPGNPGDDIFLADNTLLRAGTVIASGETINTTSGPLTAPVDETLVLGSDYTTSGGNIMSLENGSIFAGSTLADGSVAGTGGFTLQAAMVPSADTTFTVDSEFSAGTRLATGSVIGPDGAVLSSDMNLGNAMTLNTGSTLASDSVLAAGTVIGPDHVTLAADLNTTGVLTLTADSTLEDNSTLTAGSVTGPEGITLSAGMTLTGGAMALTAGSTIQGGSQLNRNSVVGTEGAQLQADMTVDVSMTLQAGSDIAADTSLNNGSEVGSNGADLVQNMILTGNMTLTAGSIVAGSSSLTPETVFSSDSLTLISEMTILGDMTFSTGSAMGYDSRIQYSSYIWADATLISAMTLRDPVTLASDMALVSDLILGEGSTFGDNSLLQAGSSVYLPLELMSALDTGQGLRLDAGSQISATRASVIPEGTLVGGDAILVDALLLAADFNLSAGSTISRGSVLRNGSGIGGTIKTAFMETVAEDGEMSIGKGSVLTRGSVIAKGTFLTSDVNGIDGQVYARGTFAQNDLRLDETVVSAAMTLGPGSVIASGSYLHLNADDAFMPTRLQNMDLFTLSDLSVLTQEDAQQAIGISDAALQSLGRVRSHLGSAQNQLTAAIANNTAAKINVSSSASAIRDVDFSSEVQNLEKLQILAEAGRFALSSATERADNLIRLLTQTDQR